MLSSKVEKYCWGKLWTRVASPYKNFSKGHLPNLKSSSGITYAGFQKEAAKKYQRKEGRRIEDPRPDLKIITRLRTIYIS